MDSKNALNQQFEKAIDEHWPKIQQVFREKVGPAALAGAKDDKMMNAIFTTVHKQLPLPVRLVIGKDKFVKYCFMHRDRFITEQGEGI
jgi:hypothetical protein